MGGTQNKSLTLVFKGIWEFLTAKETRTTAKYFPGSLNKEEDFQSRAVKDSSKWKLNPEILRMIYKQWETPDVYLFAYRVSHHISLK